MPRCVRTADLPPIGRGRPDKSLAGRNQFLAKFRCDVVKPADIDRLVTALVAELGRIDRPKGAFMEPSPSDDSGRERSDPNTSVDSTGPAEVRQKVAELIGLILARHWLREKRTKTSGPDSDGPMGD
jgi:hypothetical protein